MFLAEPCSVWFLRIFLPGTSTQCAVTSAALPLTYETLPLYVCSRRVRLIYSCRPNTSGARRLAVLLCRLVQPAVVQVTTITSVHSGNLPSGFDETFETFRLDLIELLEYIVCEMDTRKYHTTLATKPTVVPSTKRPCGVL